MKALSKRLDLLEVGRSILSPAARRWLGWALTDAERAALNDGGGVDLGAIGTGGWSREAKAWLGVV